MRDPIQSPNIKSRANYKNRHGHCINMTKQNWQQAQDTQGYIQRDVKGIPSVKRLWAKHPIQPNKIAHARHHMHTSAANWQQSSKNEHPSSKLMNQAMKINKHENHACCMYKEKRPVSTKGEQKPERIKRWNLGTENLERTWERQQQDASKCKQKKPSSNWCTIFM